MPYLRRELNDPRHKNTSLSPIEFARIALARLGEADQMQELWCRAISEDPDLGEGDLKAKIWDTWISDHKDELSRLMPTGEGVDLSDKACKNGKPIRKQ